MDPIPPLPPPVKQPDLNDPEYRRKAAHAAGKVVELTVILAAVSKVLPKPLAVLVGVYLVGLEKDPGTGKLRPGKGLGVNFAPSPIGFAEPDVFGLKPNFYLPAGTTNYLPKIADKIGLGIPQQRVEDAIQNAKDAAQKQIADTATAAAVVKTLSDSDLTALANGTIPNLNVADFVANNKVPVAIFATAAAAEFGARGGGTSAVGGTVFGAPVVMGNAAPASGAGAPVPGNILGGSVQPESIRPVNDAAKRNEAGASGIRKVLVSERADP